MIPLWMSLHVRNDRGTNIRLGLPLFLVWLLLLPFAILAAPVLLVIGLFGRLRPLRIMAAGWCALSAMRGTLVDVEAPDARVFIHVY